MIYKKPLISIIVPMFNCEKKIERCVVSLMNQTLKNIEILLINDGSNDKTQQILSELKKKDNRIRVINKVNTGVSDTRNVGIKNSKGTYIGFVDIDDYVNKTMFERLYEAISLDNIDLSICRYTKVNNNQECEELWDDKLLTGNIKKNFTLAMIASGSEEEFNNDNVIMGSVWRCLYRKSIIEENNILFREKISYAEDLIFNIEYMCKSNLMNIVNESLYFYEISTDSLSTKYRSDLFHTGKLLIEEITKLSSYTDLQTQEFIKHRLKFAYFKYAITAIRNLSEGLELSKYKEYKNIKKIIKDDKIEDSIKNINIKKLNNKYKFFYIMFKYNLNIFIISFWIFKRIKINFQK